MHMIQKVVLHCIPRKTIPQIQRSHPWITKEVRAAYAFQLSLYNTPGFEMANKQYLEVLKQAKAAHLADIRKRVANLSCCDKSWWKWNRELMHGKAQTRSVPSLKSKTGQWVTASREKANLFREAWADKNVLAPFDADSFFFSDGGEELANSLWFGTRACERIFKKLKDDTATGPDGIRARIVKFIGPHIAKLFLPRQAYRMR